MTETKTKKKPVTYPDIQATTRCLRLLEGLDHTSRERVARQILEKVTADAQAARQQGYAAEMAEKEAAYRASNSSGAVQRNGLFG